MANEKVTDLSTGTPATDDWFLFVDKSDTSMGSTGTDKKVALTDVPIDGAMVSTGTVADARIASTIARDTEVSAAVAALSTVYQPLDADLTAIAALSTTAFGQALLTLANASALRTAAALGDIATQGASNVSITGGSITGITDLAVADGGTGASTAANARTNLGLGTAAIVDTGTGAANVPTITQADARYQALDSDLTTIAGLTATTDNIIQSVGSAWASRTPAQVRTALALVIGTNVQAWDADLDTLAANITAFGQSLVDDANASAARTTLGLGTAATTASTDYQPVDSDLTSIAALTTTAFGRAFLTFANTAAVLSALSLDADLATFALPASTTISAFGATLVDDANAAASIATLGLDADIATLSLPASTTITAAAQTVLDDTTTSAMRTTLGVAIGSDVQAYDAKLTDLAGVFAQANFR